MHCPFCRHADTQVVDSRVSEDGATIRRRRRCPACDKRFTTYERVELALPSVVKKDLWWFADPHRATYTQQAVLSPIMTSYWAYNPAHAQIQTEHVWSTAWMDIIQGGLSPRRGNREVVQAGGGDLRQIPDRAVLLESSGPLSRSSLKPL